MRRTVVFIAALALSATSAFAQAPVRIVFPFGGGGSGDALTRILADQLSAGLAQTVIVELRPGASGRIGIRAVKDAAPDGSTLLMSPIAPMTIYQNVYSALGYDPLADFQPIARVATFDFGVAVSSGHPAKTLAELIVWLKANPAQANFGAPGAGTLPHFFGIMFGRSAGVDLRHVQYKGTNAAMTDLLGGHLPIIFSSTNEFTELHKAGRIRVLATSNATRSQFLSEVPTFQESGLDILATGWFGLFAPKGTPAATVARMNAILVEALAKPEIQQRLLGIGLQPDASSAEELARIQRQDIERWASAVEASGFRPDP